MDDVLDKVPGDSLEAGDRITYDGEIWVLLEVESDENEMILWRAFCYTDSDADETVLIDPDNYYDLMEDSL